MKMFGAPDKRQEPKVPAPRTPVPRNDGHIPSPVAPRGRRLADEAAQAAQNVIDLQEQLDLTEAERNDLKIQCGVLERENVRIKAELLAAQEDARLNRDIVASIETRFSDVAELLIPILDLRKKRPPPAPPAAAEPAPSTFEEEMAKLVAHDHEAPR